MFSIMNIFLTKHTSLSYAIQNSPATDNVVFYPAVNKNHTIFTIAVFFTFFATCNGYQIFFIGVVKINFFIVKFNFSEH